MLQKKAVTAQQIKKIDKIAMDQLGVSSLVLMENAGRSVAEEILKSLKRKSSVCIFCGVGNNAGDGLVAARHLINADINVKIILIGKSSQLKKDAVMNFSILKRLRYPIDEIWEINPIIQKEIARCDMIIDAIFGVGLNREIMEPFRSVINSLNRSQKRIFWNGNT